MILATCSDLHIIQNDSPFTYVHTSGSTSKLDFISCTSDIKPKGLSHVDFGVYASDHFPVLNSVELNGILSKRPPKKWTVKTTWKDIDECTYRFVLDDSHKKIRVLYQLLI